MTGDRRRVAYFSMEIGLDPGMPTYSGGLGLLAGDTVRAAADLRVPMVAVTLLHHHGYFQQSLDRDGTQHETPATWPVEQFVEALSPRVTVHVEGRPVQLRAWRYVVRGARGYNVPVYLLDARLPDNSEHDRTLTDDLYGGDQRYRLSQEVILGIGGVRMLRALGHCDIERFHMNEGHASLLTFELLREELERRGSATFGESELEAVRDRCVFTTHTPVPAGHDKFPVDLAQRIIGWPELKWRETFIVDQTLNLTLLALDLSRYINGVARRHGEVSRHMFAEFPIDSITNGVHATTWASPPLASLLDRFLPHWRTDNFELRHALSIPKHEIWSAHEQAKKSLLEFIRQHTGQSLELGVCTLGFARRATGYKRADMLVRDIGRLRRIGEHAGGLQIIYAGKAHPRDYGGKEMIKTILHAAEQLQPQVRIVYLPNYDMSLGQLITAGVDVWMNTPMRPLEASGTSGMKAALNGVPSLSILDGWWIEGCMEGVTGWAIGERGQPVGEDDDPSRDGESLYAKLEHAVLPLYLRHRECFLDIMRHAIAINGSFFNAQRMVQEYVLKAYFA
jgi:starch phosphorylase